LPVPGWKSRILSKKKPLREPIRRGKHEIIRRKFYATPNIRKASTFGPGYNMQTSLHHVGWMTNRIKKTDFKLGEKSVGREMAMTAGE